MCRPTQACDTCTVACSYAGGTLLLAAAVLFLHLISSIIAESLAPVFEHSEDCCSIEKFVKGVMFNSGHEKLSTKHLYLRKIARIHSTESPNFVKLFIGVYSVPGDCNKEKIILEHLNRPVAEATHRGY